MHKSLQMWITVTHKSYQDCTVKIPAILCVRKYGTVDQYRYQCCGSRFNESNESRFQAKWNIFIHIPHRTAFKLQKKPPAPPKKNIQHFKRKFLNFFLFLWIIFAFLESGSGSRDPIENGSTPTLISMV